VTPPYRKNGAKEEDLFYFKCFELSADWKEIPIADCESYLNNEENDGIKAYYNYIPKMIRTCQVKIIQNFIDILLRYVFIYAVGRPHPLRNEAQDFFIETSETGKRLATSAEVLQELLHVYLPVRRMETLNANHGS